jgi:KaiC/GvpD/RAD55 family RecA-like ATPase
MEDGQESRDELISKLKEMRRDLRENIADSMNALREVEAEMEKIFPEGIDDLDDPQLVSASGVKLAKTGSEKLDLLLDGGIPVPSNVLVNGPPFSSRNILINNFIVKSLESGIPVIIVLLDIDIFTIRKDLMQLTENLPSYEGNGTLKYIDTYSKAISAEAQPKIAVQIDSISTNQSGFLKTIDQLGATLKNSYGTYVTVVYSLTGWIQSLDDKLLTRTLQHFSQKRKLDNSIAIYSLDSGLFPNEIYEHMNYFVDNSIEFRLEESRESLRVRGFKNPKTKEWVDVLPKGKILDLGSFNIRRIR